MAVKIRLTRKGKKKQPTYRVVVADSRAPRDGRYIEQIGRYDPRPDPSEVVIDNDRARYWLDQGAQPSDAVRKLLEISGALAAKKGPKGKARAKVHVVGVEAQKAAEVEEAARLAALAEAEAAAEAEAEAEAAAEAEEGAEAEAEGEVGSDETGSEQS